MRAGVREIASDATHSCIAVLVVELVRRRLEFVRAEALATVLHTAQRQVLLDAGLQAFVDRHAAVQLDFGLQDALDLLVGAKMHEGLACKVRIIVCGGSTYKQPLYSYPWEYRTT